MHLHPEYKSGFINRITLALGWILTLSGITIAGSFFSSNLALAVIGIVMVIVGIYLFKANQVKRE